MKACTKCNEEKQASQFTLDRQKKDGLSSVCRVCKSIQSKASYLKPGVKEAKKEYAEKNKEKIAAGKRERSKKPENRQKAREKSRVYRSTPEYKERFQKYLKEYKSKPENYERMTSYWKSRRLREEIRDREREIYKRRYLEVLRYDENFMLKQRISNLIRASLRAKGLRKDKRSWESLVGYTRDELRAHLEAQFTKGMSWENMGDWHIDHIVPISSFKFDSYEHPEFKAAWSLTNLRPLWAEKNLSKNSKRLYLL